MTAKDIDYLLHHLFDGDCHDFKHERARIQTASSLSLFASSGSRAGAIVESSSYQGSNECLYYKVCMLRGWHHLISILTTFLQDIEFHIKWAEKEQTLRRWVTIHPRFLKGQRAQGGKAG